MKKVSKVSLVMLVVTIATLGYAVVTYGGEHCCSDEPVVVGGLEYIADLSDFEGEFACVSPFNWHDPGGGSGTRCNSCRQFICPPSVIVYQWTGGYLEIPPSQGQFFARVYRIYIRDEWNCRTGHISSNRALVFSHTRFVGGLF